MANHLKGNTFPLQGEIVVSPQRQPGDKPPPLQGEILFDSSSPTGSSQGALNLLAWLSFIMDRLFTIPGTKQRAGLNAVLMIIPVLGDIIPGIVSGLILTIGLSNYRIPRIVAARMILNSLLDISLGWIPIFGDIFDIYFKADTRNVRLLQEYAGQVDQSQPSTWKHWAMVLGMIGCLVLLVLLLMLGTISLLHWGTRIIRGPE